MKKVINFLAIILITIALFSITSGFQKENNSITGKVITGEVTNQDLGLSIQVIGILPNITIISPRNITYIVKDNLLINYTSNNTRSIWYAINGGTNITISSPILFNISSNGQYILRLYANNSDGNITSKNVTFLANTTLFNVTYEEFKDEGDTTDFNYYGYEEIQNLTNVIINKNTVGKISFQETINLTQCSNNLCDLTSHINISFNRIELNSSALPNFNKQAILTLYNLTFSNPRILKDDSLCSLSECAKISYSSGTLTFNVSSFSTYSSEETTSESGGSGGSSSSSSGGSSESSGAGGIIENPPFTVQPKNLAINLKRGESKTYELIILNSNRSDMSIELSSNLEDIISINEKTLNLKKGESKTIKIEFKTNDNLKEDNYLGNILIKSRVNNINIPVSITLNSKNSLFDIKINIENKDKEVIVGKELISNLQLYNLGQDEKEVLIKYSIKNKDNKIILLENQSITVNKETNIKRKFIITENIEPGIYLLSAKIEYDDEIASTSVWFKIKTKEEEFLDKSIKITIGVIILILLILIIFRIKNNKNDSKNHAKK